VPYLLVVGDREVESRSIAVRDRAGRDLGIFELGAFIDRLREEIVNRTR